MRKIAGLILLATALGIGAYIVYRSLVSDETLIRWRLDAMAAGFNAPDVGDCVAGLHDDFELRGRDVQYASKREVAAYLRVLVLQNRQADAQSRWPFHVELPQEEMTITIRDDEPRTASVSLLARFSKAVAKKPEEDANPTPRVSVRISTELAAGSEGWQVTKATYERIEGRFPF